LLHPRRRGVDAIAAKETVRAGPTNQHVIAVAAVQKIVATISVKRIVAGEAPMPQDTGAVGRTSRDSWAWIAPGP